MSFNYTNGRILKLELESNSSEILPVNCKFFRGSTSSSESDKPQT